MVTKSRKTIKPPKRRQARKDHPVGCRVNDEHLDRIRADIAEAQALSNMTKVTLSAYTKHAVLEHARLRRIENRLKELHAKTKPIAEHMAEDLSDGSLEQEGVMPTPAFQVYEQWANTLRQLGEILETR